MLQYLQSENIYIGNTTTFTPEEIEYFDMFESEWMQSLPSLRIHEFATTFPEAKSVIKKLVAEDKHALNVIQDEELYIKDIVFNTIENRANSELIETMAIVGYTNTNYKKKLEKRIVTNQQLLYFLESKDTPFNIDTIREIPITNFLEVNHAGFARCIWHEEKTPSMKFYPRNNKVFCFGCSSGGDVIDVYMKLFDVTFKDAIKKLR